MTTNNTELREKKIETLNELIGVTRDSADFYSDAAKAVDNPELRALFNHMADSKNGLVGAMSQEVRAEGATPAKEGTFRGTLRQLYGSLRARIGKDSTDYGFVRELEESEDRLMSAFHDVIKDNKAPAAVKSTLQNFLPKVQAHHDAMRDRKWAMQARQ